MPLNSAVGCSSGLSVGRSKIATGCVGGRFSRLSKRLRNLLGRMGDAMGASIPLACQDWANTKAAYRFFSNEVKTQSIERLSLESALRRALEREQFSLNYQPKVVGGASADRCPRRTS